MSAPSKKDLTKASIRVVAAGIGGAAGGPLGAALGGWLGDIVGESAIHLTEKFGEKAVEKIVDQGGDFLSEALRGEHDAPFEKILRQALQLSLADARSAEIARSYKDWFDNWDACLKAEAPLELSKLIQNQPRTEQELDDLLGRVFIRLDAQGAGLRSGSTSLVLKTRELDAALFDHLKVTIPARVEAHFAKLIAKTENAGTRSLLESQVKKIESRLLAEIKEDTAAIRDDTKVIRAHVEELAKRGSPLSYVWNIPSPTQDFHERPELIAQIDAALAQGVTALTALSGMGGIGKSQMARKYAELRRDSYKAGVWVSAETRAALLGSLAAAGRGLGNTALQDQEGEAEAALAAISKCEPWLVIFDNAPDGFAVGDVGLREWVGLLHGKGHVLITSRGDHFDGFAKTVSVTRWGMDESRDYLLQRTGQSDRGEAEALARELDGLALALENAAAYMNAGDKTPLAEYRKIWREKLQHVPKGERDYKDSVWAALTLSLDQVQGASAEAYDLLCLFAWLAPEVIPKKELLEAGARKLPEHLHRAVADSELWNDVQDALRGASVLERVEADGVVTGYLMHRVVAHIVRERAAEADRWYGAACDLVNGAYVADDARYYEDPSNWAVNDLLLRHPRALFGAYFGAPTPSANEGMPLRKEREAAAPRLHSGLKKRVEAPASLERLLNEAGLYLGVRGLYREQRDFQELALALSVKRLGEDHPDVAVSRSNLSVILRHLGEHEEARRQAALALASDIKNFGEDHQEVATDRSNLSTILLFLGEHEEARRQVELALASDIKNFGENHPRVAVRRSNLSNILRGLGDYAEARRQVALALASDLKNFDEDHPEVATHRNNLALALYGLGEYAAALREMDLALAILRKHFPGGHPGIVTMEESRAEMAKKA